MRKQKVTANIGTNTLTFQTAGWVSRKDLENLYTDVRFCVADLKPGFYVITDLSECSFGSLNAIATLRKIMNYLMEMQVGQVIRITKQNSLVHKQIMNFASRTQGYKAVYVQSLEEAEKLIEESDGPKNIHFRLLQMPVHFSTESENGTGYILEISIKCCKIAFLSATFTPGDEVNITLEFIKRDGSEQLFDLPSQVTEVSEEHFTAEFQDLDDKNRENLRKCIVQEAQRDIEP